MTKPTMDASTEVATLSIAPGKVKSLRVRGVRLEVVAGPDAPKAHLSTGDRVVIGSDPGADFVLSDPTVSRFHAELLQADRGVLVRDLGSTNGTRLSGVLVVSGYFDADARLTLGNSELRLLAERPEIELALSESSEFGLMVGRSLAMRRVFSLLERAAESDATVILEGPTGTGKEAAAESIHCRSARRDKPFIVVDCGAIPPDLLESELFGHERGAYTGAQSARAGLFEAAHGGTIFLDEIGELALSLQPKLLRVLERREIRRVGANSYQEVDVRVIAATHRDLRSEVNERRFRADLYYRLAIISVKLPALAGRPEDLPLLVEHLLADHGVAATAQLRTPEFLAELARHAWPGNVRELRNYLERCVALRAHAPFDGADPGEDALEAALDQPLKAARETWSRHFERRYLERVLATHGDNVSQAARAAGVDRMYFYRLLWRHGLR